MAKTVKMTEGSIAGQLFSYALPLIAGNVFQLTYNVVDSVIVGRFIGTDTLAAVGTAGPVMNLFILGISGVSMGASVIMSRFFGAGKMGELKREMGTVVVFGLYFSVLLALAGAAGAKLLLAALQVPEEILELSAVYLRLIFIGMPFTYFYNAYSSALKSVGDSRTPLYFLVLSTVLNAGLDLVLIGLLGFGIVCSAFTTVLAQAVSAVGCILYVKRRVSILHVPIRELHADRGLLGETLRYGGVTALQQACQPIGNLLIQGAVNGMGVSVMAAFNAVTKIDDYALVPERNISNAMTTFIAQNGGAGKKERIRRGFATGMWMEAAYGVAACAAVVLIRRPVMELCVGRGETAVIEQGAGYLGLMAFFYILPGLTNGIQGFYRGMGMMKMTLAGTALQTGLRVIFVYLLSGRMGIRSFAVSCAIGWCAMLLLEGLYYQAVMKKRLAGEVKNGNEKRT